MDQTWIKHGSNVDQKVIANFGFRRLNCQRLYVYIDQKWISDLYRSQISVDKARTLPKNTWIRHGSQINTAYTKVDRWDI